MSVQFGKVNLDGKPVDPKDLERVRPVLAPYGPDEEGWICKDHYGAIYRSFHTTKDARLESQPHVLPSGTVIMWDGRLDNREELIDRLGPGFSGESTDLSIVVSTFERRGTDCFAHLVGDWAVSVWDPVSRRLILAKDFLGARHLFYSVHKDDVSWCTILDPLALFRKDRSLQEEYIAGWLSSFPAAQLTPYEGIHSVPPSSFVVLRSGACTVRKYWDFDPNKRVRYTTDREYEEQFRSAFSVAVRRRLRSDSPILAELSGGMDSSSIVCMADKIATDGSDRTDTVDTISYFDDSEPNWNERPYFMRVEEGRGRAGYHIDVGLLQPKPIRLQDLAFAATPSSFTGSTDANTEFADCVNDKGYRVLLSGMGGDEVMGGVPTSTPELQDLLATGQVHALARKLKTWSLSKRKPWPHLCFDALRGFLPFVWSRDTKIEQAMPWIAAGFLKRNRIALAGYGTRLKLFGSLPSFQESLSTLEVLRRQVSTVVPSPVPLHEKRYPYLDRDLLEFIYALPREQLVRPGQRRSLMRRALVGVVPQDIIGRRRKAFASRAPMMTVAEEWSALVVEKLMTVAMEIIDQRNVEATLRAAQQGHEVAIVPLMRLVSLETWLRSLKGALDVTSPNVISNRANASLNRIVTTATSL